jgi:putative transposase
VAGRNTYLFAAIDDHSRLLVGYRWGHSEDILRLEAALRTAVTARGIPSSLYVDNGSAYVSKQLAYACATLGIQLIHSRPGKPEGKGKIERVFGTVRGQFLAEIAPAGGAGTTVDNVDALNTTFDTWVKTVYHRRVHSETGQTPVARFEAGWPDGASPRMPDAELLRQAFLWVATRQVTKIATVSLLGNTYAVDAALVGRKVELAYDPCDLTHIEVSWRGTAMGAAIPHRIGRHAHPAAKPDLAPPRPETGIDYLALLEHARDAEYQQGGINYLAVAGPTGDSDDGGSLR